MIHVVTTAELDYQHVFSATQSIPRCSEAAHFDVIIEAFRSVGPLVLRCIALQRDGKVRVSWFVLGSVKADETCTTGYHYSVKACKILNSW